MIYPLLLFTAGGLMVSIGAWMAWHPAGPLVAGSLFILTAVRMAATGTKE